LHGLKHNKLDEIRDVRHLTKDKRNLMTELYNADFAIK